MHKNKNVYQSILNNTNNGVKMFGVLIDPDKQNVKELLDTVKLCNNSVNLSAYGRIAVIASCAFLNFAADTIFIALVICIVEDIDVILLRISFKFAIFT